MNILLEEDIGRYEIIGIPGVVRYNPPLITGDFARIETLAREAIIAKNGKNFKYDAFKAYTYGDSKDEKVTIIDETGDTKGLHLLVVVPLKEINFSLLSVHP